MQYFLFLCINIYDKMLVFTIFIKSQINFTKFLKFVYFAQTFKNYILCCFKIVDTTYCDLV